VSQNSPGLHLIIICKNNYKNIFLNHCVFSIHKNVQDKIISQTIVTDKKFNYPNFDVIDDLEFWNLFDPKLQSKNLLKDTWIRQQVLKLYSDKIKKGNILIVDADLFFLKPVQFVEQNKYNFYMAKEYEYRYFETINCLLKIKKQTQESFVSDFSIFNSDILNLMKSEIETIHNKSFLEVLTNILPDSRIRGCRLPGYLLSEYELYGTYFLHKQKEKLNKLIQPMDYKAWVYFNRSDLLIKEEKLLLKLKKLSNNYYQSIRLN
jgi:hypothetical protein